VIDSTLGGLSPGKVYMIEAESKQLNELVYSLVAELTAKHGLTPLVVECGSSFNPYRVAEIARAQGYSAAMVLDNTLIVRPFTAYQLNTFFSERMPELSSRVDAVIFSHLTHLFRGRDAPMRDAMIILQEALRELSELRREKLLLITAQTEDKVKRVVRERLINFADTFLSFSLHKGSARVKLQSSPWLPPEEVRIPLTQASQLTLEEFLMR